MTYTISNKKVIAIDKLDQDKSDLKVSFGGYSSAGLKTENQDAFAALQPDGNDRKYKGIVAAIADGVSCSDRSAEASQLAVTDFISDYYSTPESWSVRESAARILNALNAWLYQNGIQGKSRRSDLVTTFSTVIFKSNTAHIFHVGDSRVYRYRDNTLEQLTRDHYRRESGDNVTLTRAMGMDLHLEIDYQSAALQEGDIFMFTTDGVHDFLSDKELKELLKSNTSKSEKFARHLVSHALNRGSDDNLSCLIVQIDSLPDEDIDEAHRQITRHVIPPVMEAGMSIDGYTIEEVIFSGTRSHLYRVKDEFGGQDLVLKAPSQNFSEDPEYLEAFIREQWVGIRIRHPYVMKVFARPQNTRFLYNIYEYLPYSDLRQWIHDNPKPSIETVRAIVKQLSSALRAFQRAGMVHRDLKPENIMINEKNKVKLIDFGTVKVDGLEEIDSPFHEDIPVGSVNYTAPEYLMGDTGVFRSDIFSLGVITYEMLTGQLPYKKASNRNSQPKPYNLWKYKSLGHYRKEIPRWVDLAIKKAVAPSPRERYPALTEFCQDLKEPNQALLRKLEQAPLMERNPIKFWQCLSFILFILLIWQVLS